MDDLFDGYMVLDGIGDFLEASVPANDPIVPIVPQTKQDAQPSKQAIRPQKDSLNDPGPCTTVSSGDTAAQGGLRQRRGHTKSRLGCIPCKRRKIKVPRQYSMSGHATELREGFRGPFSDQKGLGMIRMDTKFCNFPVVDQELLREALLSIKGFSGLMAGTGAHPIEKAIVGQLIETLQCLLVSEVDKSELTEAFHSTTEDDEENDPTAIPGTHVVPGFTKANTLPKVTSEPNPPSDLYAFANPILPGDLGPFFDTIDWENLTTAPPGAPYPLQSFIAIMAILTIFSTWPHDALMHVFDPTNQLGNVVMAHFCAIRFVLSPLSAPRNALTTPIRATTQWSARIIAAIDDNESGEWAQYVEWPKKILRCMEACIEKHKGFTMEDVRDMLLRDPGAFKEGRAQNY
ncbi:hypothetical protein G6011_07875 [Alternaria panax]|uniref:Uncharacterized protein n=1 Tax=Alternaria panax TaxID=48097 RepID=A0AAD4F971_9PLEO|nr:hypothetical protein G6011_07875 [Alternaria panax]